MAYLTVVSTTKTSITIRASATISGMNDTLRYKTYLNFMKNGSWVRKGQIDHGTVAPGGSFNDSKEFSGSGIVSGTTYTIEGVLLYSWDNGETWNEGSTTATVTATTASDTPSVQSSFEYDDWDYDSQASSPTATHTIRVYTNFYHVSPSDGAYDYKLRYWYYDLTAGETSDPNPKETGVLLSESASQHTSGRNHSLSYTLRATPGHKIRTRSQLWYRVNGGTWKVSSLGMTDAAEFTTKAVQTPPETPVGSWNQDNTNPSVNSNQTSVFYGRTFTQTSAGNVTWTLEAFLDSVNTSPIDSTTLKGTGNGSNKAVYGNYNISNLSLSAGIHYIIWRATTSGISAITTQGSFTIGSPVKLLKWSWEWENADQSWNKQKSQINHDRIQGYLDKAYTALSEQGLTTDFSYLIWNDLINWVIYNIDQLDLSYTPEQARAKGDAKMEDTVAGRTLTAYRYNNFKLLYNKLYKALGHQNNLYNNDVKTGDQVSGYSHFAYIVTNLNTSIDNYSG